MQLKEMENKDKSRLLALRLSTTLCRHSPTIYINGTTGNIIRGNGRHERKCAASINLPVCTVPAFASTLNGLSDRDPPSVTGTC